MLFHVVSSDTYGSIPNVYIQCNKELCITDNFGKCLLYTQASQLNVKIKHLGYLEYTTTIFTTPDSIVNVEIAIIPAPIPLSEISVTGSKYAIEREMLLVGPSARQYSKKELSSFPVALEQDPLQFLKQQPGIVTGNELSTQLSVRGSSPDQNIFLLNGMRLYNMYHMVGLNGVVQPELVDKIFLSKGVFPARYGNGLAAVIDIDTPNAKQKTDFTGAVSLISSRCKITVPLKKTAISLAARRTYWNLLLGDSLPYYFTDIFVDVQQQLSENHHFETCFFSSWDVFDRSTESTRYFDQDDMDSAYKKTETKYFKWNTKSWMGKYSLLYPIKMNLILTLSEAANSSQEKNWLTVNSNLSEDYFPALEQANYEYSLNSHNGNNAFRDVAGLLSFNSPTVIWGLDYSHKTFNYFWKNRINDDQIVLFIDNTPENLDFKAAQQSLAVFVDWNRQFNQKFSIYAGLRTIYSPDFKNIMWAPRQTIKYNISPNLSFSLGVGKHTQLTATAREHGLLGFLDLYFPLNEKPEEAVHYISSLEYLVGENLKFSFELYKKQLYNILFYDGAFKRRKGKATGMELSCEQKGSFMHFQAAYSYSHSFSTIDNLQLANNFDIRHRFLVNGSCTFAKKWRLSSSFQFHTGQPYDSGKPVRYYGRRVAIDFLNSEPAYPGLITEEAELLSGTIRYPNYSRLDITLFYELNFKNSSLKLFASVINVLNAKNLITYDTIDFPMSGFEIGENKIPDLKASGLINPEYLPIVPSIGLQWDW